MPARRREVATPPGLAHQFSTQTLQIKPQKKGTLVLKSEIKLPKIIVLDRGFVYVGYVKIEGKMVTIENARNIRRWGTTKGLGELANDGPTPNTKLDHVGTVTVPLRAVNHVIECKKEW